MLSNESLASEILSHGAYVCLRESTAPGRRRRPPPLVALTERLGLRNEFDPGDPPARESFALLRRHGATAADIADEGVLGADCGRPRGVQARRGGGRVLRGRDETPGAGGAGASPARRRASQELHGSGDEQLGVRPRGGPAARRGDAECVSVPDEQDGGVVAQGLDGAAHVFPAALRRAGADGERRPRARDGGRDPVLLRRTYKSVTEPAAEGDYDFVSYFECADAAIPDVSRGLRRAARRQAQPGVALRARGPDVAWASCSVLGGLFARTPKTA